MRPLGQGRGRSGSLGMRPSGMSFMSSMLLYFRSRFKPIRRRSRGRSRRWGDRDCLSPRSGGGRLVVRIEQLEYVAAVTQHGSLRRASEHLHLSQPALSEAVSKLERELGVRLLDRHRSGPGSAGAVASCTRTSSRCSRPSTRLRTAAGDQATNTRVVRSARSARRRRRCSSRRVTDFRSAHPGTTVEVLNTQQADINQGLLDGALDLGLVNLLEGDDVPPTWSGRPSSTADRSWCCPPTTRSRRHERVTSRGCARSRSWPCAPAT